MVLSLADAYSWTRTRLVCWATLVWRCVSVSCHDFLLCNSFILIMWPSHSIDIGHSQACCPPFSSPNNHEIGSCFVPQTSTLMHSGGGWCLDPVPLFENQTKQRCLSHRDCNTSHKQGDINSNFDMVIEEKRQAQMCITPHSSAELLRISFFKNAGDSEQKVIVWKGPKREVWEQGMPTVVQFRAHALMDWITVTIGKYVPRLRILPLALPGVMELLVECVRCICHTLPRWLGAPNNTAGICEPSHYRCSSSTYSQYDFWMAGKFSVHSYSLF